MTLTDILVIVVAVFASTWLAERIGWNMATAAGTLFMFIPATSIIAGRSPVDAGTLGLFLAGTVLTLLGRRHHRRRQDAAPPS